MKKLAVSLVMFLSVFTTAIANEGGNAPKINARVTQSFEKEFTGARAVKWEVIKKENIYQAHFIYNNERLNAYFDVEGNLIATGRFVAVANLPLLARKNILNKYSDYQIQDVIEYVTADETSYLVSLENDKAKLLVQGYINGTTYVFKKEKKNSVAKL
jgi:hypothetical protein